MLRNILILIFVPMLTLAESLNEHHLDVKDLGNGDSLYTLTDLCGTEHHLYLKAGENPGKPLDWIRRLNENNKLDKCLNKTIDSI